MSGRLQDRIAIVTGAGCVGPGWGNGRATWSASPRKAPRFSPSTATRRATETVERVKAVAARSRCSMRRHHTPPSPPWSRPASTLRPHRHPRQQRRRLGAWRPGRNVGGGLGRPDRLQSQKRFPHLQARAAGDGEAGRAPSLTSPRPRHPLHRRQPGRLCRHQSRRDPVVARRRRAIRGQRHPREHRRARATAHAHGRGPARQQRTGGDIEALLKQRQARIPLGFMGDGRDTANAALFLASDEARFVTGTEIIVDGGMSVRCD